MQRLNSYTNNKNNKNLESEKDLILASSNNSVSANKNSDRNGFIDIAAFNSGDLVQRKRVASNNKMGDLQSNDFSLSPNVNLLIRLIIVIKFNFR